MRRHENPCVVLMIYGVANDHPGLGTDNRKKQRLRDFDACQTNIFCAARRHVHRAVMKITKDPQHRQQESVSGATLFVRNRVPA